MDDYNQPLLAKGLMEILRVHFQLVYECIPPKFLIKRRKSNDLPGPKELNIAEGVSLNVLQARFKPSSSTYLLVHRLLA